MITTIVLEVPLLIKQIILLASTFVVGGTLTFFISQLAVKRRNQNIIKEAQAEAEVIKKDKILQAKEKFLQLKSEHERYINERNNKMAAAENKFKQWENSLSQKIEENKRAKSEIDAIRENLNIQLSLVDKKSEELEKLHKQQVDQLEAVAWLTGKILFQYPDVC